MKRPMERATRAQLSSRIVAGVQLDDLTPRQVAREFCGLVEAGADLAAAGRAARDPSQLLTPRYLPRHAVSLFDARYFLADYRFDDALGFFVAYVVLDPGGGGRVRRVHPRIFYKDSSLVWRVASHFVHSHEEYWIGKGDVRWERRADGEYLTSAEETTNLPYEIQEALDLASRARKPRRDDDAIELILREAPEGRVEPYADFVTPRRRAAERQRVNGGRRVARFTRRLDPTSLRFTPGFEPDFARGVLELTTSASKFFGGTLRKFRVLSTNRTIQYQFVGSPTHAWVNPPQTLTTELSTYGVRTLDVLVDEDLLVPGYEYHEQNGDEDPEIVHSQIPEGFAGEPHPLDPARADASAWVHAMPVVREFRAKVLAKVR